MLLLAARTGEAVGTEAAGIEELALGGLDAAASAALLAAEGVGHPEVAARLFDATGGNPLALLELSGAAERRAARRGRADRGSGAGGRGRRARVRAPARGAARGAPAARWWSPPRASPARLDVLAPGLASLGLDTAALEPAEAAGLIAVADGRVAFRHPLLRSVAYRGMPAPERRAAHAALAAALTGERRAWHLAAATVAPDEEVAARSPRRPARHAAAAGRRRRCAPPSAPRG